MYNRESTVDSMSTSLAAGILPAISAETEKSRFLSPAGWGVAVALFCMFVGMVHDFRSIGKSQDEVHAEAIESVTRFEKDVSEALPERKLAFILSALIAGYCLATRRNDVVWQSPLVGGLFLISLLWIFSSLAWSVSPGMTVRALIRVFVYAGLVFGLAVRFTPAELCRILVVISTITVLECVAYELIVGSHESDDGSRRLGGTLHPNPLARYTMIMGICGLGYAKLKSATRWKWIALVVFALVAIQLTKSRTGLASCLAGLAAVQFIGQDFRKAFFPAALLGLLLAGALIVIGLRGDSGVSGIGSAATMGRGEDVESLTGRLPLWDVILDQAKGREILGFGYGAFWNNTVNEIIFSELFWYAGHSHNSYLEILVNIGIVGLSLVVLLGMATFVRASKLAYSTSRPEYAIFAAILVAAFVNGIAESGFVLPRELAIVPALLSLAVAQKPPPQPVP